MKAEFISENPTEATVIEVKDDNGEAVLMGMDGISYKILSGKSIINYIHAAFRSSNQIQSDSHYQVYGLHCWMKIKIRFGRREDGSKGKVDFRSSFAWKVSADRNKNNGWTAAFKGAGRYSAAP